MKEIDFKIVVNDEDKFYYQMCMDYHQISMSLLGLNLFKLLLSVLHTRNSEFNIYTEASETTRN